MTGIALAGVYPPGMKIIAGWFVERRGTALGVLIGALTVGSATPHLLAWLATGMDWRMLVVAASALALAGGALVWVTVRDGPYVAVTAPFDIHAVAAGLELVHLGGEKWTTGWVARCAYEGVGGASGEPDRLAR